MYFNKKDILRMIWREYFVEPFKKKKEIENVEGEDTKQKGMYDLDLTKAMNDESMDKGQRIYILCFYRDLYRNLAATYALNEDQSTDNIRKLQTCRHNYEVIEEKIDELEYEEAA